MASNSSQELKRVLTFGDLMGNAMGQIIGSGIMSLTGVAIAMTGRSVPISFLISAVFILCTGMATVIIGSTVRLKGGQYSIISLLAGKRLAGVCMVLFIMGNISIASYALSLADYILAFLPTWNRQILAALALTGVFLVNLSGVKNAAKMQNVFVILMCVALGLFTAFGVPNIDPNYMADSFMTDGVVGVLSAATLLTWATGGANYVINLSAEAKNPKRDIPRAIFAATLLVAVLYAFMSVVAAGVLPVSVVADQPLSLVAREILPTPLYVFFMVGGAMFALITTLNATLSWATKPVMQACRDGWFPKKLGEVNERFRTPHWLLLIIYVIGIFTVFTGWDIGIITKLSMCTSMLGQFTICLSIMRIPKLLPEAWEKSTFHMSQGKLNFFAWLGFLTSLLELTLIVSDFTPTIIVVNVITLALIFLYCHLRYKSGKVTVAVEYDAD